MKTNEMRVRVEINNSNFGTLFSPVVFISEVFVSQVNIYFTDFDPVTHSNDTLSSSIRR